MYTVCTVPTYRGWGEGGQKYGWLADVCSERWLYRSWEGGGGGVWQVMAYGLQYPNAPVPFTPLPLKYFSLQTWMVWLSIAATLETHFNLSNSEQLWYLHLRSKPVTMYTSTALTCRCLRIYTWNIVNQPCQISKLGHFKDSKSKIKKQCCGSGSGIWEQLRLSGWYFPHSQQVM